MAVSVSLLQPFQHAPALDDVLVIPLDVAGLAQPALQGLHIHLRGIGIARLGGLEAAFVLQAGRWYFIDPTVPLKAGRNDPCPCGSGQKFKKCCAGYLS